MKKTARELWAKIKLLIDKVKVKVLKNIPAVRTYQRIKTINRSNKYYRIGDNQTAQKLMKQLAFEISGKDEND